MDVLMDICGQRGVKALLLIYLFVAKAAADCPKPEGGENIVLTQATLLMNGYPDNSDATLECANGYVRESGSVVITCTNGEWTEPDLTCKKKDCGPPKPQPHMSFNISSGTLFGAVVEVLCDKGYQVSGISFRQCYAGGWNGKAKCEIVTCDIPGEVTNGKSLWDAQDYPEYGNTIRYTCDEGYTLIGNDNIMCSETGEYNSEPPECKEASTSKDSPATPTAYGDKTITTSETPPVSPSVREASTSTDSPATPTAYGDKTITTSETPPVSPSVREAFTSTDSPATPTAYEDKTITTSETLPASPSVQGGRGILIAEDITTTASVTPMTSSSFQDMHGVAVDTNKNVGYIPVIVSVITVSLVAVIVVVFLQKFLLRRKGTSPVNGTVPIY